MMDIRRVHKVVRYMGKNDKKLLYYGDKKVNVYVERTDKICEPGDFRVIIKIDDKNDIVPTHEYFFRDLMTKKENNCKDTMKILEKLEMINEYEMRGEKYDVYKIANSLRNLNYRGTAAEIPPDVTFFCGFLLLAEQDWNYGKGIFNDHCRKSTKVPRGALPHEFTMEYIRWVAMVEPEMFEEIIRKANDKLSAVEYKAGYERCEKCAEPLSKSDLDSLCK